MRFCLLAILLVPRLAAAQAVTYQDRLLGQRALGMGGAYTGIADDPTASYYNPAGLTNLRQLNFEVGLPILGFDLQRIKGGLIPRAADTRDLNQLGVLAYPTTVGAAAGLGIKDEDGRDIIVVSATLMIPWQRSFALQQTYQDADLSSFALQQQMEQTALIGPAIAFRVKNLSFGITIYYVHQNILWLSARSFSTASGNAGSLSTNIDGWEGAINPRIGFMYKLTPQWTIGLMGSLSSHRLFGNANVRVASVGINPGEPLQQQLYTKEGVVWNRPLPWEIRLGAGFAPTNRWQIAADLTAYIPDSFSYFPGVDPGIGGVPESVSRRFVMNGNLGLEYRISDTLAVRVGAFSNLTSAPPPSNTCLTVACVPWVHSGGATAAVGFVLWKVALDLGLNAQLGLGSIQQFVGPSQYVWSQYSRYSLQLFVGGNLGNAINSTAEQLKQVIQKNAI